MRKGQHRPHRRWSGGHRRFAAPKVGPAATGKRRVRHRFVRGSPPATAPVNRRHRHPKRRDGTPSRPSAWHARNPWPRDATAPRDRGRRPIPKTPAPPQRTGPSRRHAPAPATRTVRKPRLAHADAWHAPAPATEPRGWDESRPKVRGGARGALPEQAKHDGAAQQGHRDHDRQEARGDRRVRIHRAAAGPVPVRAVVSRVLMRRHLNQPAPAPGEPQGKIEGSRSFRGPPPRPTGMRTLRTYPSPAPRRAGAARPNRRMEAPRTPRYDPGACAGSSEGFSSH